MNCKLVTVLGAQIALVGECERGGAKPCQESIIVDENSKVPPPPGLSDPSATPAIVSLAAYPTTLM